MALVTGLTGTLAKPAGFRYVQPLASQRSRQSENTSSAPGTTSGRLRSIPDGCWTRSAEPDRICAMPETCQPPGWR